MDLLNDSAFRLKYQKAKLKVKLWESEFKKVNGCNPTKNDIRSAAEKVRDAYKTYYHLKSLILQKSLMEISFSEDCENSISFANCSFDAPKSNNISGAVAGRAHNSVVEEVDCGSLSRLGDSLDVSKSFTLSDSTNVGEIDNTVAEETASTVPGKCEGVESKNDEEMKNVKGVWGVHLNIQKCSKPESKKPSVAESYTSQLSQKLFANAKFKIRNPRKPLSLSCTSKRSRFDSSTVESISNFDSVSCEGDYISSSIVNQLQDVSLTLTSSLTSESEGSNTHQGEKFKMVTNVTPVAHTAVNILQKVFAPINFQPDSTPHRKIDPGWLERCTKVNDLNCKPGSQSDSGIESLGSNAKTSTSPEVVCTNFKPCTMFDSEFDNAVVADSFVKKVMGTESVASDEDIVGDSESETESRSRFSFGVKRKSTCNYSASTNDPLVHDAMPDKKCKFDLNINDIRSEKTHDRSSLGALVQEEVSRNPCSTAASEIDVDEIADSIVKGEKLVTQKSKKKSGKLSKKEILEQKMSSGQVNDNYVSINLKKKVFVRGKKTMNFSKYKKQEWKKKKRAAGCYDDTGEDAARGLLTCFRCGDIGHYARNCINKGDKLLPQDEAGDEDDDVSPFPTLEQAEAMAAELPEPNRRRFRLEPEEAELHKLADQRDLPDSMKEALELEGLAPSVVQPVYKLNEDGSLIDTPLEVLAGLVEFGHCQFRPGQEEAVMRILSGLSTLVTLSTGSGKSLCYQLPAYIYSRKTRSIALVISPLVSLMEDQVTGVPGCLRAACLHTVQSTKQRQSTVEAAKAGKLDVLLVSPEAVVSGERSTGFGSVLRELPPISFACVDEVHCVSQWSHNFRPSYLMICQVLREKLGVRTILGLTATATKYTQESIARHIEIPDGECGIISDTPVPSNLVLSVSRDAERDKALIAMLCGERFRPCRSIIVYCTRREECERLAALIRTYLQDSHVRQNNNCRMSVVAEPYHAGLSAQRRKRVQKSFMSGQLRIVVATVAFGMGINKADIRGVIHYNMPRNFESYVQEVGRAGRDGLPSHCHLFLDDKGGDVNELRRHIHANSVDRHVVRRLLQRVFVSCKCSGELRCPGHEVAFPVDETVRAVDLPQENILTMLCYLHLNPRRWLKVLSPVYTRCKVLSYKGPAALRAASTNCAPLAMAIALDRRRGVSHEKSNSVEFPVVDVAAAIGWDSGLVKARLKNLEWHKVEGKWRRTGLSVDLSCLGFRVLAPGNLPPHELDEVLDTLHERVLSQESQALAQLHAVFSALTKVSLAGYRDCADEFDVSRSEQLKKMIREYFQQEQVSCEVPLEEQLLNEEQVVGDVRALVCSYRDTSFTGRSVARIFHGIASPCFPAQVWGRCRFWRAHLSQDFKQLCRVATREIIRLK